MNSRYRIFLLLFFPLFFSTCKKASKFPFDLTGIWYSTDGYCDTFIEIKSDYSGQYGSTQGTKGCGTEKNWKGKVRFTDINFFIGNTKFHWISKPQVLSGSGCMNFSLYSTGVPAACYTKLATMTLKTTFLHSREVKEFFKLIEYP